MLPASAQSTTTSVEITKDSVKTEKKDSEASAILSTLVEVLLSTDVINVQGQKDNKDTRCWTSLEI